MVRDIVKDPILLSMKSTPADSKQIDDAKIGRDLLDTFHEQPDICVGMAANMIGCHKRIIVYTSEGGENIMYNPRIIQCSGPYMVEEGCLCLQGTRMAKRFAKITVVWQDMNMVEHTNSFSGITAQIIQHECDHLEGIII